MNFDRSCGACACGEMIDEFGNFGQIVVMV